MAVTDIVRPEIPYTDDWMDPEPADIEKAIHKYNYNAGRFLFFPWGCWVTAYARRNLFTGILEFQNDYIYSDTDSLKVLNAEKHMKYIEEYNRRILQQLAKAVDHHGLDPELIRPRNQKGEEQPLGIWDFDGHYSKYKSLGAKRYMVQYSQDPRNGSEAGKYSMTVAGLNKRTAMPYLLQNGDPFEQFQDDLFIPPEYTGKLTHTYIDDRVEGVVYDYYGRPGQFTEESAVHLGPADYSLSIAKEYVNYILSIREEGY